MGYISKYDRTFLSFVNKKYKNYEVSFEFFDDYILWLYYEYSDQCKNLYYKYLENDLCNYVEFQSGKERDIRGLLNE